MTKMYRAQLVPMKRAMKPNTQVSPETVSSYGQVNTKVGDMVVFLYFIICLRSHIEVNAYHYEGGEVE